MAKRDAATKTDRSQEGLKFEQYVHTIFKALGYAVEYDLSVRGQQTDLVAQRTYEGVGQVRLLIECKYRSATTVDNQSVHEFVSFARATVGTHGITKFLLVSNVGLSTSAKEAIRDSSFIEFRTIAELEGQLLDFSEPYVRFTKDYETKEVFRSYISLSASQLDNKGAVIVRYENVQQHIESIVNEKGCGPIFLLGDYGAGKTTMMLNLKYCLAKRYQQGEPSVRPILFYLKEYHRLRSLNEFITYTLFREFNRDISLQLFWDLAASGKLLLLLDGFDEMSPQLDAKKRSQLLLDLNPLLTCSSPSILTCRPAYFVSYAEYANALKRISESIYRSLPDQESLSAAETWSLKPIRAALEDKFLAKKPYKLEKARFQTLTLDALDAEKVQEYLIEYDDVFRKELGATWREVKVYIESIYDLGDLMTRPILLNMITTTVLAGKMDISDHVRKVSASDLYELYTDLYFDRDLDKGETRQFLSKATREQFATATALFIFDTGEPEVSHDQLKKLAETRAGFLKLPASLDMVVADLRICTFLTRSVDDKFRFIHKSFCEYFVARFIFTRLKEGVCDPRLLRNLPKEIAYFLGGFIFNHTAAKFTFVNWFREGSRLIEESGRPLSNSESAALKCNLAKTLLYGDGISGPLAMNNLIIEQVEVKQFSLSHLQLQSCEFRKTKWLGVSIQSVEMEHVLFSECEFRETSISDSNLVIRCAETLLASVKCKAVVLRAFCEKARLENWNAVDSEISLTGRVEISESAFENSRISCSDDLRSLFSMSNCTFKGCQVIGLGRSASNGSIESCTFDSCKNIVLCSDRDKLERCSFVGCSGVVFYDGRGDKKIEKRDSMLWVSVKGLIDEKDFDRFIKALDIWAATDMSLLIKQWCLEQGYPAKRSVP